MAFFTTPERGSQDLRRRLAGLAIAATTLAAAGPALAQIDDYGGGYAYYGRGYERDYGYERRYDYAPLPPAPIPQRAIGRVAAREFGLVRVDRTIATRSSYVVDGTGRDGARVRLILDRYSGELIDRIVLGAPMRSARLDPQIERPAPRLIPRPPPRPAELKPPAEASAPATVAPPSPAAPAAPVAVPAKPLAVPAVAPREIGKPTLVNPQDVRNADAPELAPPLARAHPSGIPVPDTTVPPVRIEGTKAEAPKSDMVPVAPLN
jgi:hypothetical protein